jgi:hypothetical protein
MIMLLQTFIYTIYAVKNIKLKLKNLLMKIVKITRVVQKLNLTIFRTDLKLSEGDSETQKTLKKLKPFL